MYTYPTGVDPNAQPVTFAQVLGNTHTISVRAQLEKPDGTVLAQGVTVLGGEVRVDRTAAVRRQCSLNLSPTQRDAGTGAVTSVVPLTKDDPLAPFGNLARVYYGISAPTLSAAVTWWPQGLFRLSETNVDDDGSLELSVMGYDLARTISRNKLTTPWVVAAGTNFGAAIIALAQDRYPYLKARAHTVTAVSTSLIVLDAAQDPWAAITDWATVAGCSVYFDVEGYLAIVTEPNPTTDPVVWTYQDTGDQRNALLVKATRSLSDEPGYNGVVLTSESAILPTPLRSEVWDTDSASPTYYLGPYGKVPKFVSNPYVGTQAQADAAARAELLRINGGTEQISASVVANPAHEAGDVLRVARPTSGINQTTILEGFTLPLSASSPMTLTFRERRVLA